MLRTVSERKTWDDLPDFFGPPDLARLLGVNATKGYEIARRKDFPARREGRKIIISKAAARRYLEAGA